MAKHRWLYLLLVLVAIAAVAVAQAETPAPSPDCAKERFLQELAPAEDSVPDAEPALFAPPTEIRSSRLTASSSTGDFTNDCWHISCSDGTSADCCGSEDTCRWMCETYCGGEPCIFIWP